MSVPPISVPDNFRFFKASDFDALPLNQEFALKFKETLPQGFFYVKIPKNLRPNVEEAKEFARTLEDREEEYKTLTVEKPFFGYEKRNASQAMALCLRYEDWDKAYPPNVQLLARHMHQIALRIIKCVLNHFKVPQERWNELTGKVLTNEGKAIFTVLNFKPELEADSGLPQHQDIGWVTILINDKEGLRVKLENGWVNVPFQKKYYIVNFGTACEDLINNKNELRARYHYVEKQKDGRVALALFTESPVDAEIWKRQEDGSFSKTGKLFKQYIRTQARQIFKLSSEKIEALH